MKPFIFDYSQNIKICETNSGILLSLKLNNEWIITNTYPTLSELMKEYPLKKSKLSEFYQERFFHIISEI